MRADAATAPASFELVLPDGTTTRAAEGTTVSDLVDRHGLTTVTPVLAAYIDNYIVRLDAPIAHSGRLRLVEHASLDGAMIYERSLVCLLHRAVRDVFPEVTLTVNHSTHNAIFCELLMCAYGKRTIVQPAARDIERVAGRMRAYVEADEPFEATRVDAAEAARVFREQGAIDKAEMMRYREGSYVYLYQVGDYWAHYHGYLAPRTGVLGRFELRLADSGFLLCMPAIERPFEVPPAPDAPKLFAEYREYERWCERLGVSHVAALNGVVSRGDAQELILIMEALHEKRFAAAADAILARKVRPRIICVSGPSSSGKTTVAKRLRIQLRVNGIEAIPLGLDDYFVDRERNPRDEHGNYDFEVLEALDLPRIGSDVSHLIAGDGVTLPKFDFREGKSVPGHALRLAENQMLLLEGLHALNPRLLARIPDALKFYIYISPLTALNIDETSRIRSSDVRILRRLVRDNQFRGYTAEDTLRRRPSLRRGEERHIFPFQERADLMINTSLAYELGVLKNFADPLLSAITPQSEVYSEARRLLSFLTYFLPIPVDKVPTTSVLREFVGSSVFVY